VGLIKNLLFLRRAKYSPIFAIRGDYQANGNLTESDIIGAIADCIGRNVGKLSPQVVRTGSDGLQIRNDHLARLLSTRWSAENTPYDVLYRLASDLVYKSNAYAVVFYTPDYMRVESIVPVAASNVRVWEDPEDGNIYFRFTWDYDGNEYTLPYAHVIHLKARYNKKRFIGTAPDNQLTNTLELLDYTGENLKNAVLNSTNLKGYLKYNNFISDEELKQKVADFKAAYMNASNASGIAGLDNSMDFHEISTQTTTIPTTQAQYLRDNIYRYYGVNDKILTSTFTETEWNAFYENVIEPIALQLTLEFTFKLLTERERGHGNKIIFTANRLQYATLQTRLTLGSGLYDRGIITINEFRELMYYEPIEDGDVRMVSLNYVKADEQSQYQIGEDGSSTDGDTDTPAGSAPADLKKQYYLYVTTKKKGE